MNERIGERDEKEGWGTMGPRIPGVMVSPLKGVSTVTSMKHRCTGTFTSMGYYNDTEKMGVRTIIERFENIRKVQDIKGSGLCGLRVESVRNKENKESDTYSSPGKRRRITLCNTEKEGKGGGERTRSPRGSWRRRGPVGTATPPSRGTRQGAGTGARQSKLVGVPPTLFLRGASPP